ncbi:MAG: TraB/GumN family protein [Pyrinomonadaceae bacterium]
MNKFYGLLMVLSGILLVCSHSIDGQAKTPRNATGILYKITGQGLAKPSYLFGTVHVICTADMFPLDELGRYLDQTDRLVMELNLGNLSEQLEMAKGLTMPAGKTLKSILTPDQYSKVDEMLMNSLGIDADNVQSISPVALQVMILSSPKMLGCKAPTAYEIALTKMAGDKKKPIEGLETAQFQRETVDKIPIEAQAQLLYEMALDPMKSVTEFKQLITVYKLQDSEKLYETINKQIAGNKDMETQLVGARNETWMPKIEAMIKEKSSFIAVGGGHLGGPGGLVSELRKKGYKLKPIAL